MLIYKIENKLNSKIYIGQTVRKFKYRIAVYRSVVKNKVEHKQYILRAMKKYGFENFEFSIIENNIQSQKELDEKEIYWIAFYNSVDHNIGYNLSKGGHSRGKFTEETKKKLAAVHLGKKHSEETKEKIRAATIKYFSDPKNREKQSKLHAGKKLSDEAKKKIVEACKNRVFTEEARAKISLDNKNRVWTEETKIKNSFVKCRFDYRQAQFVRNLYSHGNITCKELASMYNCSTTIIYNVINNKSAKLEEKICQFYLNQIANKKC